MAKHGAVLNPETDRRLIKGDKPWHVFPKRPGLYTITHIPSGRRYVGCAVDLRHRIWGHIWYFKKGIHHNPRMQRLWDRDGEESLQFSLHSTHDDIATLEASEAALIAELDTFNPEHGFNMCKKAISAIGRKWNPAQREKMVKWPQEVVMEWVSMRIAGKAARVIASEYGVCRRYLTLKTQPFMPSLMKRTKITDAMKTEMQSLRSQDWSVRKIAGKLNIDKKCVYAAIAVTDSNKDMICG